MNAELLKLQAKLLDNYRECKAKAETVKNDDYLNGLLNGYASAYQLAAGYVNVLILNLQTAEWDKLLNEMQEVQA